MSSNGFYQRLAEQAESLLCADDPVVTTLANASALIFESLDAVNWAGFYLYQSSELVLGPFQGKTACTHIAIGRGVCGNAAKKDQVERVQDVYAYPGHIACDSASRSEIVLPVHLDGRLFGVLDIDSPAEGRFDIEDEEGLRKFVYILEEKLKS